jgi:hypothetical protein
MKAIILFFGILLAMPLVAQEYAPPPPKLPEPQRSGEALEPEVTIIESDKGTSYEYRLNGQLYMVKIQPKVGKPYYEVDSDGDGELETRVDDIRVQAVPQWVLFRF